jgi:hypothetical protein
VDIACQLSQTSSGVTSAQAPVAKTASAIAVVHVSMRDMGQTFPVEITAASFL